MFTIFALSLTLILAQSDDTSVHVATYLDVQIRLTNQGISLIKQYRDATRMERGNSTVDVIQEIARPNRFVIIETWKDQPSFEAHERAEHTAQFRSNLKAIHSSPFDQRVHQGFAMDTRAPSTSPGMIFAVTHVDVPPPRTAETEMLLKAIAGESRKDQGNIRYDVFQQSAARNHFTIFEVWKNRNAFDSHEATAHTRQFREALGPMLGAPYDERLFTPLK